MLTFYVFYSLFYKNNLSNLLRFVYASFKIKKRKKEQKKHTKSNKKTHVNWQCYQKRKLIILLRMLFCTLLCIDLPWREYFNLSYCFSIKLEAPFCLFVNCNGKYWGNLLPQIVLSLLLIITMAAKSVWCWFIGLSFIWFVVYFL